MADTDLVPYDQGTFGSQSTPRMAPQLARAAAAAREMLIDRAAAQWNVDRSTLTVKDGRIVGQGRSAGFGEITKGQKLAGAVPAGVSASPVAQWTLRGTAPKKVDGIAFVTGRHRYTPDITRPGMLYGAIIRPDGYTGTLASMDDSSARAIARRDGRSRWHVRRRGGADRAARAQSGIGDQGRMASPHRPSLVFDGL